MYLTLIVLALIAPRAAEASTYRWGGGAAGDWNVPGNWVLVEGPAGAGYPNLPGDVASIEPPLTQATIITIRDTVTVAIGRLSISANQVVTIASAGTGLLVFDNAGEHAEIVVTTLVTPVVSAPVRLDADLDVQVPSKGFAVTSLEMAGGISEAGGGRTVTMHNGSGTLVYGVAANTYTGPTIIGTGTLSTAAANPATVRIAGDLIVGVGLNLSSALISAGSLAPTADVTAHGRVDFLPNGNQPESQTIDDLTIPQGAVTLIRVLLDVATLNTNDGDLTMGPSASLVVHGDITATSGAGPARIHLQEGASGSLRLDGGGTHALTVADGPRDVDIIIAAPITGEQGGEGLTKQGPGQAALLRNNTYTGPTTITAGTLYINGEQPGSAVTMSGGVLAGSGIVGPITATNGSIAPGGAVSFDGLVSLPKGTLRSGSVTLGLAALEMQVDGGGPGNADQLQVTGTVDVTNARLLLTSPFQGTPAPLATITIIQNDGADPVQGVFVDLPEGAIVTMQNGTRYALSYRGGDGNDVVLANITPLSYFLSEGATGTFFEENVLIANANTIEAPVTLTFLLPGGGTVVQSRVVGPQSRLTLNVADIPGLEAVSASVRVVSDRGVPLAVERTMFWDHTRYGGHTEVALRDASLRWYFAEGSQGFFDTYLLLANANDVPVETTITFLREAEPPVTETVTLEPLSRRTIYAGDNTALVGRSFGMSVNAAQPITAERAMYFGSTPTRLWSGGHGGHGAAAPSDFWFHAEGATGTFFTTFFLLSNPDARSTPYRITYLLPDGQTVQRNGVIGPLQRVTINPAFDNPLLGNASFSTIVQSFQSSDLILPVGIVSERAMYWPGEALPWGEGHVNMGTNTNRIWDLAEGRVGGAESFVTYILIANPSSTAADVTVTFLRENGAPIVKTYSVGAHSRFNIDVASMVPELRNEAFGARVAVTNDVRIAVERSMYWNVDGVMWAGGTNAAGTPQ